VSSDLVQLEPPVPFELARSHPGDRYFDYCLQPYQARRPPQGKLRSENLLWQSLHMNGCADSFTAPLGALQQALGRDMTVWGAKYDGSAIWWELYFYDPQKEATEATLTGLRHILAPWIEIAPTANEATPYMMVSFDLFPQSFAESRTVSEVNLYLTGTEAHEGRSYRVHGSTKELANTYCFMEPKRDIDRVLPLLKSSVFVDYTEPSVLSSVLIPELFACKRVCVAKKRFGDGIYFSGIHVEQLLWFLERFDYPEPTTAFIRRFRDELDHLYFDVGIDYSQAEDGTISYPKTSFYGTL